MAERDGVGQAVPVGDHVAAPRYSMLALVAGTVVAVDQIVKAIIAQALGGGSVIEILGGLIRLDYTRNSGAAFGMFQAGGIVFAAIAVGVSAGILIFYRRVANGPRTVRFALGLILGGALGNLIDRVRLGYVVDFIDLRWWPVFNLADSAIVIGVCLLFLQSALREHRG